MYRRIKELVKKSSAGKYVLNNRQQLDKIQQSLETIEAQNRELLFANIFRDSIQSSEWLKDTTFSAYRSAANYSLLYKLFKIYDVYKPKNILELGLGQTTKLTTQYLASNASSKALVIDNSKEWIDIYQSQIANPESLSLIELPIKDFKKGNLHQVDAEYDNLDEIVGAEKFDLIIVDGPLGHMKKYSRTNILDLVNNLASEWVVIFDDAERQGEQNTINLFVEELAKSNIDFSHFKVKGSKTQHYFSSPAISELIKSI